jgi:hypothetical protein
MTLEQAVEVLNRERHNNFEHWSEGIPLAEGFPGTVYGLEDGDGLSQTRLTEFEAIAIAEKLERDHSQDLAELKKAVLLLNQSLVSGKNPLLHSDGFGNSCLCDDCMTVVRALGIARGAKV